LHKNYEPYSVLPGKFSQNDGTIDFYSRVRSLVKPSMTVLDLGAGRGEWFEDDDIDFRRDMRLLKGRVKQVIACDMGSAVLKNKSVDTCLVMTGNNIPCKDNSIDLIVSDFVVEHIMDTERFFEEINRVLKPNGYFCARTPHKYHYVSIVARIIKNSRHSWFLRHIQPNRKEEDIFPTAYKMNTLKSVSDIFSKYQNNTFIYNSDPAYFFGKKIVFILFNFLHSITPVFFHGNLFIFLRKSCK
jgi:ubiquinone/menaquinone biosynthesis C-methylase UbiE